LKRLLLRFASPFFVKDFGSFHREDEAYREGHAPNLCSAVQQQNFELAGEESLRLLSQILVIEYSLVQVFATVS